MDERQQAIRIHKGAAAGPSITLLFWFIVRFFMALSSD